MDDIYRDLKAWHDFGHMEEQYRAHGITSHAQAWDTFVRLSMHEELLWLALSAPCVPAKQMETFFTDVTTRALKRVLRVCTDAWFVSWANNWLSRVDRTRETADALANMAWEQRDPMLVYCAFDMVARRDNVIRSNDAIIIAGLYTEPGIELIDTEAADVVRMTLYEARSEERDVQAEWWRTQPNPFM